eukprot:4960773-Pyramimonas_sp.AAC.1
MDARSWSHHEIQNHRICQQQFRGRPWATGGPGTGTCAGLVGPKGPEQGVASHGLAALAPPAGFQAQATWGSPMRYPLGVTVVGGRRCWGHRWGSPLGVTVG